MGHEKFEQHIKKFFPKISKSINSPKNCIFKKSICHLILAFFYLRKFSKIEKKNFQRVSKCFNSCKYDVFEKLICKVNCGHFVSLRISFTKRMGFELRSLTSMPFSYESVIHYATVANDHCVFYILCAIVFSFLTCAS